MARAHASRVRRVGDQEGGRRENPVLSRHRGRAQRGGGQGVWSPSTWPAARSLIRSESPQFSKEKHALCGPSAPYGPNPARSPVSTCFRGDLSAGLATFSGPEGIALGERTPPHAGPCPQCVSRRAETSRESGERALRGLLRRGSWARARARCRSHARKARGRAPAPGPRR